MRKYRIPVFAGAALLCLLILVLWRTLAPAPGGEALPETFTLAEVSAAVQEREGYRLRAAVLYEPGEESSGWRTTLGHLRQSPALNLEADALTAADGLGKLKDYDLLVLDESLLSSSRLKSVCSRAESFARQGGSLLVPNGFLPHLPAELLGCTGEPTQLRAIPEQLDFPQVPADQQPLQTLIADFHSLYLDFADLPRLQEETEPFWAVTADTAVPLCQTAEGKALYTLNQYGRGLVLFCSPLLPNRKILTDFSLEETADQLPFSPTAASCGQLFLSRFASLCAKERYGFSMERVFGSYGSPSMSWELHYEDIGAIENNSMEPFSQKCEAAGQIPSFTLVRCPYAWFSQMETVTYALNQGGDHALDFQLDRRESVYSSGTHIDSGYVWLQGSVYRGAGSYFDPHPEENYRYCPWLTDYDGDGAVDLLCGSQDGKVYAYRGLGFTGTDARLKMEPRQTVEGVAVSGYSAPCLGDLDGDGIDDLLLGGEDGSLRWYHGAGGLNYQARGTLLHPFETGQCLPALGDVNGDGVPDLVLGSDQGQLLLCLGAAGDGSPQFSEPVSLSELAAASGLGDWLSPFLCDYDGDGKTDLILGCFDGYVALFPGSGDGSFRFGGYITVPDANYKGNNNFKFGTYCSPRLSDLDGDGSLDLLCGYEEYGLAYPINSDYFPYQPQLQAQIAYMMEHYYYLGVHFLTGAYASAEREAEELAMHKEALAAYGVDTSRMGVNQHTWFTSSYDPAQTLESIAGAGLLWQSGFSPSSATLRRPQNCAENVIALPFFLTQEEAQTLLVQDVSVLGYGAEDWTDLSARYGMPMCVYYHCDLLYQGGSHISDADRVVEQVSRFQEKHGYNFLREDQMMLATAAAYNLSVDLTAEGETLTLTPQALSQEGILYDQAAQSACGVKLDFAEGFSQELRSDARVWKATDAGLYLGLDGPVTLSAGAAPAAPHLEQVNLPAEITADAAGASLRFLSDGMMQVVVVGAASTPDPGWTVVPWGEGRTKFTKFGAADTLRVDYQEASP